MTATLLTGGRVLLDGALRTDRALVVEGGRIAGICAAAAAPQGLDRIDLAGDILLPGFVDIQVNGGGGVLFNDAPSVATIRTIAQTHARFGTTALLPTLISDDLDKVATAIAAVEEAISVGVPGVIGIHLEGPFLSTDRKGVHDASKFRPFLESHVELMSRLKGGVTVVTLSPEQAPPHVIAALAARGVRVCAGHTNATYDEMRLALDAGVSGFTHLFNAMSPLTSREPGVVGAALEDQASWCGLIVDGAHVAPATLRLALRCKPLDRFMLVTDAMPSVGMADGSFVLQGRRIHVEDGTCRAEDGTLAGSDLDMLRALRNAIEQLQLGLPAAASMAGAHPAAFLGLEHELGSIRAGARADFVILRDDFSLRSVWMGGKQVHG